MKIAEALSLRAEYQEKIVNLLNRIMANLKVQESDVPHEDPNELLKEVFELHKKLSTLIKQINLRNNTVTLPNGKTLSEALTERESLLKQRSLLASIAEAANERDYRLTRSEIKMTVTFPVAELQKRIDDLSREFRELDTQIQAVNWTVEL